MLFSPPSLLHRVSIAAVVTPLVGFSASDGHAAPPKTQAPAVRQPLMTGEVVDGASGKPLNGATVYVYTAAPRTGTSPFCPSCYVDCGKRGATGARGRFQIPVRARSLLFRLLVVRDGYEPAFVRKVDPLDGKPRRVTLKKLSREAADPSHLVLGRVLDNQGKPVVGATVEPFGRKSPHGALYGTIPGVEPLAITDEKGLFRFHTQSVNTTLMAKVQARNLAPSLVYDLNSGSKTPREVRLGVGTTVAGTVRRADGKPVPGNAVVHIVHTNRDVQNFVGWFEIGTNKDGTFSLPNVPPGRDYLVCVRMDSLTGAGVGVSQQKITTGKDNTTKDGLTFTLQPTTTLAGTVTLPDGKALPDGTRVLLSRKDTWDVQQALIDRNGRFTFRDVPQGDDFELYVHVDGYHLAEYPQPYAEYPLKTTSGKTEVSVTLVLAPDASKNAKR